MVIVTLGNLASLGLVIIDTALLKATLFNAIVLSYRNWICNLAAGTVCQREYKELVTLFFEPL